MLFRPMEIDDILMVYGSQASGYGVRIVNWESIFLFINPICELFALLPKKNANND